MGLQAREESNSTFLAVAGGYIWDKKAEESHPNYSTQDYETSDGVKQRKGARFNSLLGKIVDVKIGEHDKYGDSIQVTVLSDEERYIVSISVNNRYSQDMLKMLLKVDFSKDVLMTPYDSNNFKNSRGARNQGISFKQDGEKINLRNDDAPFKDSEWFKTANKKAKKRFFEDLTEWFLDEVRENVINNYFSEDSKNSSDNIDSKAEAQLSAASVDNSNLDDELSQLI